MKEFVGIVGIGCIVGRFKMLMRVSRRFLLYFNLGINCFQILNFETN